MKTLTTNGNKMALVLIVLFFNCSVFGGNIGRGKSAPVAVKAVTAEVLRTNMQTLWENNVVLTRNVIICIVNFQPGIDVAAANLVRNHAALADAVKLYYGDEAGEKFTKLLHNNIVTTADFMIARRSGRLDAYEAADKKWKENTEEILVFLGQTNPNCNRSEMRTKAFEQVQYTKDQITAVKNKDVNKGAKAYDNAIKTGTAMAGIFSDGIIKQFPERFEKYSMSISQK